VAEHKIQEQDTTKTNLSHYSESKNYFTGKASEVSRTIAFGGIAVVWLFRKGSESSMPSADIIPDDLQWPLVLFVFSLGLDLLHYIFASLVWTLFYRWYEYKIQKGWERDEDIVASRWNYRIIDFFFWMKIVFNMIGFGLLLKQLICMI
jgi:hypothetical protein